MSSPLPSHHRATLWLIGGTSESIALAHEMHQRGVPTLVTVTTEAARDRYATLVNIEVQVIRFGCDEVLQEWIRDFHIHGILDASHPFATEISSRAIRVADGLGLSYLRFERASITAVQSDYVSELDYGIQYLSQKVLSGQRVLLTVGSQVLNEFAQWQGCADLYARILPSEAALKLAYQAGFSRDRIIALQPPLSFELEYALWKHWQISLAITKASGQAGGEDIKRQVAEALQIPLMILKRPAIDYPWQTQSLQTAVSFAMRMTQIPSTRAPS